MNIYMYNWPESSTVKPNTTQYCQKSRNNFNSRVFGSLITGSRRINCKKKKECLWCYKSSILGILQDVSTGFWWVYIYEQEIKYPTTLMTGINTPRFPAVPEACNIQNKKPYNIQKQSAIQSYKPYTIFSSHNLGQIRM